MSLLTGARSSSPGNSFGVFCYFHFVIKTRATCRPKSRCQSDLSTVSVLANKNLHQDLMHSGCRGTAVPNVCLQAFSLFPLPSSPLDQRPVHRLIQGGVNLSLILGWGTNSFTAVQKRSSQSIRFVFTSLLSIAVAHGRFCKVYLSSFKLAFFKFKTYFGKYRRPKTNRTQIHFLSDVLFAVASLNLKVPIIYNGHCFLVLRDIFSKFNV